MSEVLTSGTYRWWLLFSLSKHGPAPVAPEELLEELPLDGCRQQQLDRYQQRYGPRVCGKPRHDRFVVLILCRSSQQLEVESCDADELEVLAGN